MKRELFSPALREAMKEIRRICKRYDIGANVLLFAKSGHTEFGALFDVPTWSVLTVEEDAKGGICMRIRAKSGNAADQENLMHTIGMLAAAEDLLFNGQLRVENLLEAMRQNGVRWTHVDRKGTAPDSYPKTMRDIE